MPRIASCGSSSSAALARSIAARASFRRQVLLENEKGEGPIEAQLRRESAQADGALMGAGKDDPTVARLAHEISGQHQARAGNGFEGAEIGTVFFSRLQEALQGVFQPDACVLVPEAPASSQQIFRLPNGQPVAELGLAGDPGSVFSQHALDFIDSSGNRVLGNLNTPCLANHLAVIHQPPVIANQNFESAKRLRPQLQWDAVPK